jgi:hypothetical protein
LRKVQDVSLLPKMRRAVHAGLDMLTVIADLGQQLAQEYRVRVALCGLAPVPAAVLGLAEHSESVRINAEFT